MDRGKRLRGRLHAGGGAGRLSGGATRGLRARSGDREGWIKTASGGGSRRRREEAGKLQNTPLLLCLCCLLWPGQCWSLQQPRAEKNVFLNLCV